MLACRLALGVVVGHVDGLSPMLRLLGHTFGIVVALKPVARRTPGSPIIRVAQPIARASSTARLAAMPPKGKGKRKAKAESSASDDEASDQVTLHDKPETKKAKPAKEPLKPLDPTLPINRVFPPTLTLPAKSKDTIRFSTWRALMPS